MTSEQVNALATQLHLQQTAIAYSRGTLNVDAVKTERVRSVAHRLIRQTGAFRTSVEGFRWEVNVVQSNALNAECLPGGKITVYSGIIDRLALTDDELAAVLGHEIAHALREHAREKMSQHVLTDAAVRSAIAASRNPRLARDVTNLSAELLVHRTVLSGDGGGG